MNNYGVQVSPTKLIMTETGRYQQQVVRPMTTHIGMDAVARVTEATQDFTNINPKGLRDFAKDIIAPSAEAVGNVDISGGWGTRRFRFIMTVTEKNQFNHLGSVTRIIYGYTDEGRISASGVDPEQRFYFNSETVVTNTVQRTTHGQVTVPRVSASHQIINGFSTGETNFVYGQNTGVIYTIRPEDVYTSIQNENVVARLQQGLAWNGEGQHYSNIDGPVRIHDARNQTGAGGELKLARRSEHAPAFYLSELLRGYKEGVTESDDPTSTNSVAGYAQSAIANESVITNNFLSMLREHCSYNLKGYVTYRELCSVFKEMPSVTHCLSTAMGPATTQRITVGAGNGRRGNGLSDVSDSNHWHGATEETIAATMLGQIVPSIMSNTMFQTIAFTAFNGLHGRNDFVVQLIPDAIRMVVDGLDAREYGNIFISQLKDQVLVPISQCNQRMFSMTVSCDLVGETIVDISMDGNPMERFVAPSFADSLTTSLTTTNFDHTKVLAEDLKFLVDSVGSGQKSLLGYLSPQAPVGTGVPVAPTSYGKTL